MQKVRTPPRASGSGVKARRLPVLYVLFWSLAGAASAAYLGIIVSDPDLVSALSGPAKPGSPLERPNDELFATPQVDTLRDRLSNAQTDIAKLRSELDDHKQTYGEEQADVGQVPEEQTDYASNDSASDVGYEMAAAGNEDPPAPAIAQPPRVGPHEHEVAPVAAVPGISVPGISVPGVSLFEPPSYPARDPEPPAPVSEVAIANAAIENGPAEPSSIETGAIPVPPAPEPGLRPKPVPVVVVSEPEPTAVRTAPAGNSPIKVAPVKVTATPPPAGSPTPPAQNVAFAPATVSRSPAEAKETIGVRLATGQSLEALRVTWKAMQDRHPEALKGLAPRYVQQDALGSAPFALVAGPVSKPMDVLEICADLGGEARECALAAFAGKKL